MASNENNTVYQGNEPEDSNNMHCQGMINKDKRDAMAEGLLDLLRPAVEEVDLRVKSVRESQVELRQHIDDLDEVLKKLATEKEAPIELDGYVKKLTNCKRKITVINSILHNAQDRLQKLNQRISKNTGKRSSVLSVLTVNQMPEISIVDQSMSVQ
ncbi:SNARE-associated protein Snapin-like isoform X1 [Antedon mediterranea]|uniref:SNARE-associated protein Snapin-like isoform X1 n=1 Tax=Antedon mediterranea TaxID=105859 RepID=UPI003AF626C4